MTQDEFIDKWLVGYESREQKEEFVIEMMADLASLQSKGKTKEEVWKITAENKLPICYKTGEWDGKQSDLCLCVDTEGKHHLATCYESNGEFEWYDKDDFGLRHEVVKWAYVEAMEEYAQSHAKPNHSGKTKEEVWEEVQSYHQIEGMVLKGSRGEAAVYDAMERFANQQPEANKDGWLSVDRKDINLPPLSGNLERIEIKENTVGKYTHTWLYLHGVRTFAKAGPVAIHLGRTLTP